ncbi:MAG: insulinase family protein, partial [Oscillospiraceae bacterium]|nr:insulinase family protein [Oscillospiraceae bacterium]
GTASCPDMTLLRRRLNSLYGASMTASYTCAGFSRVIDGCIEGVDDALVREPSLSAQREALLTELLLRPALSDGAFNKEWLDIEREKLRDDIRSIINDKRDYCMYLLADSFYKDARRLPTDGYEEDLDAITPQGLYEDYLAFLRQCNVEIIYVGQKKDGLSDRLAAAFDFSGRGPAAAQPLLPVAACDEQKIERRMAVEQDKLALAFTTGELLDERGFAALRLASALLGGSATSRLFVNVREKLSLCYYAASRVSYRSGGGLFIDCGIEHQNVPKAREAILRELAALAQDGPTERELTEIKLLFENILGAAADTSGGLEGYCYNSIVRSGRLILPREELELLRDISAREITQVLRKLHLNASCLLEKEA